MMSFDGSAPVKKAEKLQELEREMQELKKITDDQSLNTKRLQEARLAHKIKKGSINYHLEIATIFS